MMHEPRLYGELAPLFPWISRPQEYAAEADCVRRALCEKLGPGRHALLELGAGAGHLLSHLTADFAVTAVDLSPDMLAQCRKLNPGVPTHVGDMRSVRLGQKFQAVFIGDAVAYMLSADDLRSALRTAAAHLDAGGVLLMAPDWFSETFPDRFVSHDTCCEGTRDVTFIEYCHDPDPSDTTAETVMFFLVRDGGRLRIEQDRHTEGVFSRQTWLRLMEEAGFTADTRPYVAAEYAALELLVGVLR